VTFSALTLNMQNAQVWDETDPDNTDTHIGATIDFLKAHPADVIFLQEVERGHDGGGQVEPPPNFTALRAALAGYDAAFAYPPDNPLELPFGLGLAIFSRTKLRDFTPTALPAGPVEFEFGGRKRQPSQRLVVSATTVIGGREVRLLNTHLQAFFMIGSSSDMHPAQRDALIAVLAGSGLPSVLGGDFNCSPEEGLLAQFEKAGYRTSQSEEITWKRMPFVVDHLLYNAPLECVSAEVIRTEVSDHDALRAEFSFAPR